MLVTDAIIVERRPLGPGRVLLWLSAPDISRQARPGQFVMVRVAAGLDPFLPRPFWVHRVRDTEQGEEFALLVQVVGRGTELLAGAVPGQRFAVTGPLGRPLALRPGVRHLLLLAAGVHVAPLVWLADEECARGRDVTLLLSGETAAALYPLDLLPPALEVQLWTGDGTAGRTGTVLDGLDEFAPWADQIVAALPDTAYAELAGKLRRRLWQRPCTALLHPPLACGTGLCGDCPVSLRRGGRRLVCRDGPAFELRDLGQ